MKPISGASITWWRTLPIGGLELVGFGDSSATFAVLKLPTLPGGSVTFDLPAERAALDAFCLGLSHGHTLGRHDHKNEMRAMLGFEASHDVPRMEGVRHAR